MREQPEAEARLKTLLAEGLAKGGADIPVTRAFWKDLKAEASALVRRHRGRKKP